MRYLSYLPFLRHQPLSNKRSLHRLLPIIAVLLFAVMPSASNNSYAETEAEYQQRLIELSNAIKALQAELNNTKNTQNELQQSLQQSEENIAETTKKVNNIKEALAREKKRLNQLQSQRTELEQQQQQQEQYIAQAIGQTHRLGQQGPLKLLLNQENPERVARLMQYHRYIVDSHQEKISHFIETLNALKNIEKDIISTTHTLEKNQTQLQQRQKTLQSAQRQRRSALNAVKQSLKQKGRQLSTLSADRQRLQTLLDEAINQLSELILPNNAETFTQAKGKLPLPTQGKILFSFGSSQFDGQLKRNGIFIRNQAGANVVSVHHGRVIFSDYLRGHGLLLIIDHGDGYMSLYAHNQTLLKDIGDWTDTGEKIATVGNSGGQLQNGLYFEIRHKGRPQNPKPWLRKH